MKGKFTMTRYRFAAFVLLALLLLTACAVPGIGGIVRGSGNIETESRDVRDFSRVELSGSGTLLIQQGESEALTIEADDNLLPLLTSDVNGDRLVLGTRPNTSIQTSHGIRYHLTVVDLEGLELSGSGEAFYDNVATDTFTVEIRGSGDVSVAGQAERQIVQVSGSGKYIAPDLLSGEADIDVSGSGEATVNVTDSLDVEISGSGDVTYIGNPEVAQDISGSGDLHHQ